MLELIRKLEFYGGSENIEIAKGKYELPLSLKDGMRQIKRKWHARKR